MMVRNIMNSSLSFLLQLSSSSTAAYSQLCIIEHAAPKARGPDSGLESQNQDQL